MVSKTIRPQDLLVEFRDRNLVRQGSIPMEDLNLKFQPVFNGAGSWSVTLPAEHRAVPYLRAPGAGIVVTNLLTGETLISGSTSKPSKKATSSDPRGMVTIAGLSDDILLWQALAFPQPSNADPETQTEANDVRTAKASTLMQLYVNANIGPGSPAGRRGISLRNAISMGVDPVLGAVTTRRPRFDVLGDLLGGIALEAGLAFRIVQVGSDLEFQVYQPADRTGSIRLDVHNGTLQEQSVETAPPEVTRVIVAGQGKGTERQILQFETAESTQGEDDWGFIIEEFKDQRNTDDVNELESSAMERLNEAGFTKVAVKATPSNDQTMIFMTDFFLGDRVAVVIDDQETTSIITEAAIVVDSTGLFTAVAVGDIYDFDSDSALRQTVTETQKRLDNLERNAEIGSVGWGDILGKPTTFPPSDHTQDWATITGKPEAWAPIAQKPIDAVPADFPMGQSVFFSNAQAGYPATYGAVQTIRSWSDGGGTLQFWTGYNSNIGQLLMRQWPYPSGPWTAWKRIDVSDWADILNKPATFPSTWTTVSGKPTTFAPSPHTHPWTDITGKPTTFAPIIGSGATQAVAGNDPRLTDARTPTAHAHPASQITDFEAAVKALLVGQYVRIGSSKATTGNQTGITTTNTEITGASVSFTLDSPATVLFRATINTYSSSASDLAQLFLRDETTTLEDGTYPANSSPTSGSSGRRQEFSGEVDLAAGVHRLNVAIARVAGSGSITVAKSANGPARLVVDRLI